MREWAGDRVKVMSAGSHPADEVSRRSIQVMEEIGIDISDQYPKSIESVEDESFDWVITLCDYARDFCPDFHGSEGLSKTLHWPIEDPYVSTSDLEMKLKAYREARDEIGRRIAEWMDEELGIKVGYE